MLTRVKWVLGLHGLHVTDLENSQRDMLNDLKWETLETRRNNQRLSMFYRMQHNMVSISSADYLAPVQSSRSRSGHDQMYQVPYTRTNVYKYSFSRQLYVSGMDYQHR